MGYNNGRWLEKDDGIPNRVIEQLAIPAMRYFLSKANGDAKKRFYSLVLDAESIKYQSDCLKMLKTRNKVVIRSSEFDKNPHLLNLQNGTYDLKLNVFNPHEITDYLTKQAPATFNAESVCPRWLNFLSEILPKDIIAYLQVLFGACLSGVLIQKIWLFLGNGGNGKSVLLRVLGDLLGSGYCVQMPQNAFIRQHNTSSIRPELVDLRGSRLAISAEIEEGALNESLIKNLVGGDLIRARNPYERMTGFAPTHKLIISGNGEPSISGTDRGIWRRVRKVSFDKTITKEIPFDTLVADLIAESSGILNWLLEGWKKYQKEGLIEPESIRISNKVFQADQDSLQQFIDEQMDVPGPQCTVEFKIKSSLFIECFNSWLKKLGFQTWSSKTISNRLTHKGFIKKRYNDAIYWVGMSFSPEKTTTGFHPDDFKVTNEFFK